MAAMCGIDATVRDPTQRRRRRVGTGLTAPESTFAAGLCAYSGLRARFGADCRNVW